MDLSTPLRPVSALSRPLRRWAERSQRHACDNALVASRSLAGDRRERDEVATYLADQHARRHLGSD